MGFNIYLNRDFSVLYGNKKMDFINLQEGELK